MSQTNEVTEDDITNRYADTYTVRKRAIDILSEDKNLDITLADSDRTTALIKFLDGQDKQTTNIARTKQNQSIVDGISNVGSVANAVIDALGGLSGLRGSPGRSQATEVVNEVTVEPVPHEMDNGPDEGLTFDSIMKP